MFSNLKKPLAKVPWVSFLHHLLNGGEACMDGGMLLLFDVLVCSALAQNIPPSQPLVHINHKMLIPSPAPCVI